MTYGLRFYSNSLKYDGFLHSHNALEEGRSDFDYIFRPVYHLCEHLLIHQPLEIGHLPHDTQDISRIEDSMRLKFLSEVESCKSPVHDDYYRGGVLGHIGPYVYDDWITFIAVHTPFEDVSLQREVLPPAPYIVFQNWDGVYWQCFTDDKTFIDTLISTHKLDRKLTLYRVDFKLDFPNPREQNRPGKRKAAPLQKVSEWTDASS